MANLFCVALSNEQDQDVVTSLAKGLCHVLMQARDPSILDACSRRLKGNTSLLPILQEIAKDSADYPAALALGKYSRRTTFRVVGTLVTKDLYDYICVS